jgi:hypothetical protein
MDLIDEYNPPGAAYPAGLKAGERSFNLFSNI